MKFYMKNTKRNVNAILEYKNDKYYLKKGSIVSKDISQALRSNRQVVKRREGNIDNNYTLIKDVIFSSPSTAGEFVLGTSCNGREKWKSDNGKKLKELI